MHLSVILLQLAGAVMLLLYSTRMVRTGFERAAGPALRTLLLRSSDRALKALLTGSGAAILLQSSTAVALLVAGFASSGVISLKGALTIVFGADVGTALVVQFLSTGLEWLIPLLLACGGLLFLKVDRRLGRQIGRILLGIAFILIALKMIGQATEPLRGSAWLPGVVDYLGSDEISAFIGGALLAFVFHSSVAAILLFATLCAQSILPIDAALALTLGANAGGSLLALWLTRTAGAQARRITLASGLSRIGFALLVLLIDNSFDLAPYLPGIDVTRQLVNFHLLFNLTLVLLALPLVSPLLALTHLLVSDDEVPPPETLQPVSALDESVLDKPDQALASATRELLRMSQQVEIMMAPVLDLFTNSQPQQVQQLRRIDRQVNTAHTNFKLYVAELNRGQLSVEQARRSVELTGIAINLEHAGDIIAEDLLEHVAEKHKKRHEFSTEGWRDISTLHARVLANMQLSLNVLISDDLESAKELIIEKARMGELERETRDRHLHRLVKGMPESVATSSLHLDVIRSFREINSLYTAVAYPILSQCGVLLDNRIAEETPLKIPRA